MAFVNPYKGFKEGDFQHMELAPGWMIVKGILASDSTALVLDESTQDYAQALYHKVLKTGPDCRWEEGAEVLVVGNTLSPIGSWKWCLVQSEDVLVRLKSKVEVVGKSKYSKEKSDGSD